MWTSSAAPLGELEAQPCSLAIIPMVAQQPTQRQPQGAHLIPELTSAGEIGKSRRVAHIHLIIGPVGAGKSTFAHQLARERAAVHLNLDEWMANLFRQDRPDTGVMEWYRERTGRCIEQIWKLTGRLIEVGTDVVLEIGLIQQRDRRPLYKRVDEAGHGLKIYVLDAARDVRRERVEQRNRAKGATFSMVVPPAIFDLASDLWEPPDEAECSGRDVRFLRTDEGSAGW